MVWDQLSINKPHLVYIILGGFTSLFMLCSSIIKERLYIGEATVATICGIIFGPHAANLIDPASWGNVDQITLEFSRIVLVVQCFAVGVELPKYYMEKHWRSVTLLLVPVMTFGWLITSLFIWAVFKDQMNWLDCLVCAACVTATDPVLASSVVGKGKFAQRIPRHLRDLLSAESGCNDGMAFPFIYLGLYLVRYRHESAALVAQHWILNTILYECIWGATYGVLVGYIARRGIRYAHEHNLIDRESFLVFYFVLALFCAGSGALLGMDDLLVGFACGVGFSNDGWFLEKTEEAHVSNVIDLLINLAFFVYFGTVIPWQTYSSEIIGTTPWKLVVIAILVLLFRRIPIMLAMKPIIPDIKNWREALFAGHFGPMGVGALFVAILARAELETDSTTPLKDLPPPDFEHANIIELIWPITTFLVITSILIHGSSIAVFTLGKHVHTLSLTMSFTKDRDLEKDTWMDRLPRIQSRSKTQDSMKTSRPVSMTSSEPDFDKEGNLEIPKGFLSRQKVEETPKTVKSFRPSKTKWRKNSSWDEHGPGGPVTQSAIGPVRRPEFRTPDYDPESPVSSQELGSSDTAVSSTPNNEEEQAKHENKVGHGKPQTKIFEEGDEVIIEDEEGNVLKQTKSPTDQPEEEREQYEIEEAEDAAKEEDVHDGISRKQTNESGVAKRGTEHKLRDIAKGLTSGKKGVLNKLGKRTPGESKVQQSEEGDDEDTFPPQQYQGPSDDLERGSSNDEPESSRKESVSQADRGGMLKRMGTFTNKYHYSHREKTAEKPPDRKAGPARAFKFGNTIIVEDEDGEVIKKYELPGADDRKYSYVDPERTRQRLQKMGKWMGMNNEQISEADESQPQRRKSVSGNKDADLEDDDAIRFTVEGDSRRMSKADFFQRLQSMDPKKRVEMVESSDAPEGLKQEARDDANEDARNARRASNLPGSKSQPRTEGLGEGLGRGAQLQRLGSKTNRAAGTEGTLVEEDEEDIPIHNIQDDLHRHSEGGMTAAEARRRAAAKKPASSESDSEDDGTERVPPSKKIQWKGEHPLPPSQSQPQQQMKPAYDTRGKTKQRAPSPDADETAAERRRREAALGQNDGDSDSDSEDDTSPRRPPKGAMPGPSHSPSPEPTKRKGITFAGAPSKSEAAKASANKEPKGMFGRVQWGGESGR